MDEIDEELIFILACCETTDEVDRQITKHAAIVQRLVCRAAWESHQTEEGIRALYASFADMAVEQFKDGRQFPAKKPH